MIESRNVQTTFALSSIDRLPVYLRDAERSEPHPAEIPRMENRPVYVRVLRVVVVGVIIILAVYGGCHLLCDTGYLVSNRAAFLHAFPSKLNNTALYRNMPDYIMNFIALLFSLVTSALLYLLEALCKIFFTTFMLCLVFVQNIGASISGLVI